MGLDETDVIRILQGLTLSDFKEKKKSKITKEWLYVFVFSIESCPIYMKLILRTHCLILSFHEDEPDETK